MLVSPDYRTVLVCFGSQCVNMRNPSARDNVLSSCTEIVSNALIFKGSPLCPYKHHKVQDSTPK